MSREILFNSEARKAIKKGVDTVADAVKVTLGAAGRNVVISNPWGYQITKDGVTVARSIDLKDPIQNTGAQMIKEVAEKMLTHVGDSTTTSIVLAQQIINLGMDMVDHGANPMELKKGIDYAVTCIVGELKKMSVPCNTSEMIHQIATVAANHDKEIGDLVAEAFSKITEDGQVLIDDSISGKTEVKIIDGYQFEKGWMESIFVTDPNKMVGELKDPYILIYDGPITKVSEIQPILTTVLKHLNGSLLIICNELDGEAFAFIGVNRAKQNIPVLCVQSPAYGANRTAILEDLAAIVGGDIVAEDRGDKIESIGIEKLGRAGKVFLTRNNTTIFNGHGDKDKLQERTNQLKSLLEDPRSDFEMEFLKRRIAKLAGGVAVISVGGASSVEQKEKKDRCDDSVRAVKSALEEGIVPGGGIALARVRNSIVITEMGKSIDFNRGFAIMQMVCLAPFNQILLNSGIIGDDSAPEILENISGNQGYDVISEKIVDMIESGIIDPTKAARCAIEFSASVAGLLLTTECLAVHIDDGVKPVI